MFRPGDAAAIDAVNRVNRAVVEHSLAAGGSCTGEHGVGIGKLPFMAAEHGASVMMAWKDKMDLSVGIATISSVQIALFVTPVLVLSSMALGQPMALAFEVFELVAIILSVAIVSVLVKDGETNWYEGVLLLLVYAIIAVGFFFHP